MARRPQRGLLVLAAAAIGLLVCRPGSIALVAEEEEEGHLAKLPGEVAKVARFWEQPHNLRLSHKGVGVSSISQGKDQWQFSVSEGGDPEKAGMFASQHGGSKVVYGLEYDSKKSNYSVADAAGVKLKHVAVAAVSKANDPSDLDWTFHVEGDQGRHFSATGDKGSVAYDGSFGLEVPVVEGVKARYAFDAKRRPGSGLLPAWFRSSAGLRYASPAGELKMHVHQPDPDFEEAPIEYEASLEGEITGPQVKGSPKYTLKAARDGTSQALYLANLKMKGPEGLSGGVTAAVRGGKSAISAFGEYELNRTVADGITVAGDAKAVLSPPSKDEEYEVLNLHPIGLTASADLSKLMPSVADAGSTLDVRTRYKLGARLPAVIANTKLKAKKLAGLQLEATAAMDDSGKAAGKLKVSGSARGVDAQYETVATPGIEPRHVAQVLLPPTQFKSGTARAFGRLYKSELDNDGKPRLQLGVQYDLNTDVAGREVRVEGDSAAIDSGSTLLRDDGLAWRDARQNRIRLSSAVLRTRIDGSSTTGHEWMHK